MKLVAALEATHIQKYHPHVQLTISQHSGFPAKEPAAFEKEKSLSSFSLYSKIDS